MDLTPTSDDDISRMARHRVSFKMHAFVYVLVNLFLAGVWLVTSHGQRPTLSDSTTGAYYWPIWTHLGWGLGLALHGFFSVGPGQGMQAREEAKIRERLGGR
jgi:hypothetical protein